MTPISETTTFTVPAPLKAQVAVAPVKGGQATLRWWGSKVSAQALQQILTPQETPAAPPSGARH